MGPEQVQGTGPEPIGPDVLFRNLYTGPRQREEPRENCFCCASPAPCTCPGPVLVQCESALRGDKSYYPNWISWP